MKSIIAILAILVVAGCSNNMGLSNSRAKVSTIPLVWKPTTSLSKAGVTETTGRARVPVRVEVIDNRPDAKIIGRNSEELPPRKVTTTDDVATFVNDNLSQLLAGSGVTEIDSSGSAVLKAEIQRFFVEEANTYRGDVRLKFTLVDSTGSQLWSGIASGASTRFGRSFRAENYYEVLSDSLIDAVRQLTRNESFRNALRGMS